MLLKRCNANTLLRLRFVKKRTMLTRYLLMSRVPFAGVTAPKNRHPRGAGVKEERRMMRLYAEYVTRKFPYARLAVERTG